MQKPTAILSLFFVAVIWASTFPIIKLSLQYISSWGFVALRFLTGFFILSIFFARKLKMDRETLFSGAMLGIVLFAGYFFQTLGLQYTSATHSGFIV
ncbi:EamA family transporter, partial [Euryarchaeota archaeon ex4484_178]